MKIVDMVNGHIALLEADVRKLAKAQAAQLRPSGESFFIQTDDNENDISRLNANISRLFSKCNEQVKLLAAPHVGTDADLKVRKNVQMALAGKLQDLSCTFRKKHKQYLQQLSDLRRKTDNLDTSFQFDSSNQDDDDDQVRVSPCFSLGASMRCTPTVVSCPRVPAQQLCWPRKQPLCRFCAVR
eukprot:TRINITY_DN7188_c0_g1_i3.p1 TRINITY_DN7188_c0_g1~~TRINITY_DN7188_c0_g1_i3.p1  ORF type:complete len:184 (+),score=49.77 TRINITY_DN7188_c0_g1_i3:324-875(+)